MTSKLKVFISHYRKNTILAKVLKDLLNTYGYFCWLPSDTIRRKTENVEKCDVMILLIDRNYILSKSCVYEAKLAAELSKETIPVLIEKIIWPMKELGEYYESQKIRVDLYGTMNTGIGVFEADSEAYERILCAFQNNEEMRKVFDRLKTLFEDKTKFSRFKIHLNRNLSPYQSIFLDFLLGNYSQ